MKLVAQIESLASGHFVFFRVEPQEPKDREILRRFGEPGLEFLPSAGRDRNASIWNGEWGVTFFGDEGQARAHVERLGRAFTDAVRALSARWEDEQAREARKRFEFLP